jgi:hypothetical protein
MVPINGSRIGHPGIHVDQAWLGSAGVYDHTGPCTDLARQCLGRSLGVISLGFGTEGDGR